PAVVGEPELVRARIPIEADGITDTAGERLETGAVGVHAHDVGVAARIGLTDVAGGAHRHVGRALGAEGAEPPALVPLPRGTLSARAGGGGGGGGGRGVRGRVPRGGPPETKRAARLRAPPPGREGRGGRGRPPAGARGWSGPA